MCGGAPPQHCVVELYPKLVGSSSIPTLELHPNIAGPTGPRSCGYFSSILTWKCSPTLWGETLPQLRGQELHPDMVGWNSTPALWCGKTPQHCGCNSNPALWQLHPLIGVETLNIVWWSCSPTKTVGRNSTPTLLGGSSPRHLRQSADPVELYQTLRGGSPPQQCWVQIQPDKGCNSTPTSRPGVEFHQHCGVSSTAALRGGTPPQQCGVEFGFMVIGVSVPRTL